MTDKNKNYGFKTDAFNEALHQHEEMEKNGVPKNGDTVPGVDGKDETFTTTAFQGALEINEEMNKRAESEDNDTDRSEDVPESEEKEEDEDDTIRKKGFLESLDTAFPLSGGETDPEE